MEGYQNYQQVIDTLKAEYVNARNLKKTANTKKRATRAAASAKTRKDAERGSLESKLTTVKSSILSNLVTAFNNMDSSEYSGLKNELTNLKGKLAFINSEIDRLGAAHYSDPAKYPEASATELQTLNSLRNTLTAAIYESEAVIGDIYNGADYNAIKNALLPNQFNNTQEEVLIWQNVWESRYNNLYDAFKTEFNNFITELVQAYGSSNQFQDNLVYLSKTLLQLKSQLADLLDDQASQSMISDKENQIEGAKAQMLADAAQLKQIEISIDYFLSSMKMEKLKRMSSDLFDLGDKLRNYNRGNYDFLVNHSPDTELFVSHKSFDFYQAFFNALDGSVNNKNFWTSNGNVGEFSYVFDKGRRAKQNVMDFSQFQMKAMETIQGVNNPDRIMDATQQNNGGGNRYFHDINGFKNNASNESKEFYVNYFHQLHTNTRDYIDAKVSFDFNRQKVSMLLNYFNQELFDHHISFANAARIAKRQQIQNQYELMRFGQGKYTGTGEQEQLLQNLKSFRAELLGDLDYYGAAQQAHVHKLNLHVNLFPDFYPDFDSLTSVKISASASYDSAYASWNQMEVSKWSAYDYLQTLTAGESSYVAALADYEAKRAQRDSNQEQYSAYASAQSNAYNFLQTTLAGEAEYQAALPEITTPSTPPLYTEEYVNSLISLHYIFVGAQAEYDSKLADQNNYYTNVFELSIIAFNDATAALQDLTDEDAAYQAAFADWNSLDTNSTSYKQDVVDTAYLALQAATSALDSHLSDYFGEELGITRQGVELKAVKDAKEQVSADLDSIQNVLIQSNSLEISDLESQMTWVYSNPLEKRDAMLLEFESRKKSNSVNRITGLIAEHNVYIPHINSLCNHAAQEVRQRISQGFDGLLLNVKNFLEEQNSQANLYAGKIREERYVSFDAERSRSMLNMVIYPTINNDWYLGNVIGHSAQSWSNSFDLLRSDSGISDLMQTIRNKFDQSLRKDNGSSFADRIINEVVNGYPIV